MKCIIQPLYNFLKMCNLCIAITINLFANADDVWRFGEFQNINDQNLGGSDELYYVTIQFSKNAILHCNYHQFIFAN